MTFKEKARKNWVVGVCKRRCCTQRTRGRKKWCVEHEREIRREQLRLGQRRFQNRIKQGYEPKRYLMRKGKPTKWAKEHPMLALAAYDQLLRPFTKEQLYRMVSKPIRRR